MLLNDGIRRPWLNKFFRKNAPYVPVQIQREQLLYYFEEMKQAEIWTGGRSEASSPYNSLKIHHVDQ
jgi:hypothetical protein